MTMTILFEKKNPQILLFDSIIFSDLLLFDRVINVQSYQLSNLNK